jgi:carbon monoxide dehydrogenase subunit G
MSRLLAVIAILLLGLIQPAFAHGPSRQKIVETVEINKSPDEVWTIIKDFGGIANWLPGVASSPADKDNQIGSVRVLTLKRDGSPTITEKLEKYDPAGHSYFYRITDVDVKVLPVNNYSSTIQVKPGADGKGSIVEWRGAFYRGFPNNDPPPELNDEAAIKAVTAVYRSGLDHLKEMAEKGQ